MENVIERMLDSYETGGISRRKFEIENQIYLRDPDNIRLQLCADNYKG